jgi:hypothetical protein
VALLLVVAAAAAQLLAVDAALAPAPSEKKKPVVPAVIVFGDSTMDTGNNNAIGTILKSNFPPYGRDLHLRGGGATGRFCNGRLPPDFVSEALGLPPLVPAYLDPAYTIKDFATGVVFASAGTGLDNRTASVLVRTRPTTSQQHPPKNMSSSHRPIIPLMLSCY